MKWTKEFYYFRFTNGCRSCLIASLYRHIKPMPWSGLTNTVHGINLSAEISPKPWLVQLLQWDLSWRNLKAQTSHPTFASRSFAGHSLKSSLFNRLTINTLDDSVLPSRGVQLQLGQELAGLGLGNVAFLRTVANGSIFQPMSNLIGQVDHQHSFVQKSQSCLSDNCGVSEF